jgi:hypothetical protein
MIDPITSKKITTAKVINPPSFFKNYKRIPSCRAATGHQTLGEISFCVHRVPEEQEF